MPYLRMRLATLPIMRGVCSVPSAVRAKFNSLHDLSSNRIKGSRMQKDVAGVVP